MKATRKPGRFTSLFARIKGATETSLIALISTHPSLRIYNIRPAFIDDTQDDKLKEGKKSFLYNTVDKMAPLLRAAYPNGVSPTGKLAEVLIKCVDQQRTKEEVEMAFQGKGVSFDGEGERVGVLIENVGLRRLAGL